ncbi:MAG: alpha-N-acetylglucosaminidase [Opitutales bacterium]|nr:alpha-N-acetylglucosaminidase [Opitutales bacterium]
MKKSFFIALALTVFLGAAPLESFAGNDENSVPAATKRTLAKKKKKVVPFDTSENAKTPALQREQLVSRLGVDDPADVSFKIRRGMSGFELKIDGDKVTVTGGNDNDLVAGYGYYLREVRGVEISWSGKRYTPAVPVKKDFKDIALASPWQWRYAYNYCTLSYTSAFWGKKEWAEEIDRMALCGMNYLLVQAGLEKVWQLTLQDLGYPKESIAKFIPAPAFAAWWNMGNLEGHGGPLSQKQIDREAELGRFIVRRMENYGMHPIVQGFTGLVPHDFAEAKALKKYNAKLIDQGNWVAGFKRPVLLDPTNEAFPTVAEHWYKNLKKVYGYEGKRVPAAFGGDLFHEGGKTAGVDVSAAAKAVQDAQQKAAPGAVWVLQSWHGSPRKEIIDGIDKNKAIVLGLCLDMAAGTQKPRSFWGTPWLWCELSNFGGNHGMYGSLRVLGDLGKIGGNAEMKGIGIIPEGTEVNPFFYDLFFDRVWMPRDKVMTAAEIDAWIGRFVRRRYGKDSAAATEAWRILERSLYRPDRPQEGCTESILCATPAANVQKASSWSSANVYWNGADTLAAFEKLIAAGTDREIAGTETYRWDLCDLGRQFLSDLARSLHKQMMAAYDARDLAAFNKSSADFLATIDYTDRLLATHSLWRFGRICEQAKAKGSNKKEQEQMLRNAKMLVTTWSEQHSALENYSHRQLAGLMKDCYGARWKAFVENCRAFLEGKKSSDAAVHTPDSYHKITDAWRDNPKISYSSKAEGDTLAVAGSIYKKFAPVAKEIFGVPAESGSPFSLNGGGRELAFDVTDKITAAGTFAVTVKKTRGEDEADFVTAKLYEDDKMIDSAPVRAGTAFLKVARLREGLGTYTVKLERASEKALRYSGSFNFEKR